MRVPHTVRTVAEVIGMPGAVRLMQASNDWRYIYVPTKAGPGHRLASVLKPDELAALQHTFRGELLPYPSARGMKRRRQAERKAQAILRDIAAGLPTAQVATNQRVSERYVRRLKAKGTTSSGWRKRRKNENAP